MLEHERASRGTEFWSNQIESDELVESRRHLRSLLHDQREEFSRESATQDRRGRQRVARKVAEAIDTGDDDPLHGGGDVDIDVMGVMPSGPISHQHAVVFQRAHEFLDEEWIPCGRLDDALLQRRWKDVLSDERGEQRQILTAAQCFHPHHFHAEIRDLIGASEEPERRKGSIVPKGEDEEDRVPLHEREQPLDRSK